MPILANIMPAHYNTKLWKNIHHSISDVTWIMFCKHPFNYLHSWWRIWGVLIISMSPGHVHSGNDRQLFGTKCWVLNCCIYLQNSWGVFQVYDWRWKNPKPVNFFVVNSYFSSATWLVLQIRGPDEKEELACLKKKKKLVTCLLKEPDSSQEKGPGQLMLQPVQTVCLKLVLLWEAS